MSESNSVKWYCWRCLAKENVEKGSLDKVLRVCSGCGVEQYCWPAGHAGEDVVPKIPEEEALIEAETLTDGQEVPLEPEEVVGSVETLVEEILEEKAPENETMTLDEQIAELQAKKAELEAKEE